MKLCAEVERVWVERGVGLGELAGEGSWRPWYAARRLGVASPRLSAAAVLCDFGLSLGLAFASLGLVCGAQDPWASSAIPDLPKSDAFWGILHPKHHAGLSSWRLSISSDLRIRIPTNSSHDYRCKPMAASRSCSCPVRSYHRGCKRDANDEWLSKRSFIFSVTSSAACIVSECMRQSLHDPMQRLEAPANRTLGKRRPSAAQLLWPRRWRLRRKAAPGRQESASSGEKRRKKRFHSGFTRLGPSDTYWSQEPSLQHLMNPQLPRRPAAAAGACCQAPRLKKRKA